MNAKDIAKRKAKSLAVKTSKKVIGKIVASIGLPTILAILCIVFIAMVISAQVEELSSGVSILSKNKKSNELNQDNINFGKGKATYVGVDDRDTDLSRRVLRTIRSSAGDPFRNGYAHMCEAWTCHIYSLSGQPVRSWVCCAYHHSVSANKKGKIPKGALIFSGKFPNRSGSYVSGCYCPYYGGSQCGHTAIYIGNGMVAGSQIPYMMSLDKWIDWFGYGGWSTH